MPEGVDSIKQGRPLDGITPEPAPAKNQRGLLLMMLLLGGAFLLFYLIFAFVLMATLPDPTGGRQGLRLFGNLFYGGCSAVALALLALVTLRFLRSGVAGADIRRMLLRPGSIVLTMLVTAVLVFLMINREVPLPIDILEPANLQGLTAPVTITFGTESLRAILQKQSLYPRRYKWDFDGNGTFEAEKQDQEIATVYRRKGVYTVILSVQLSDGSVRRATRRISIPNAVFSITPLHPVLNEMIEFSAADLIPDPKELDLLLWDFDGDGQVDTQGHEVTAKHAYTEIGTYQAQVTVQAKSGVQERSVRPITIVAEIPQPFEVSINAEGPLKGSAPLGVIFKAKVQEGVKVQDMQWFFGLDGGDAEHAEKEGGERVAHTFKTPGQYRVTLEVKDAAGRIARKALSVSVLEALSLSDLVISGTPKPDRGKLEGTAPLEVELSASTRTPFITFKWEQEHASKVFSTETDFHALYEEPGTYPVLLIARDAEDRVQKVPLEILVDPPKSRVAFTAVPPTGIAPLTVTFDASQSSVPDGRITGFAWTFGDEDREGKPQLLGAQVTHRYEAEGTYVALVRALTEEGQSFEARKTIVVRSSTLDACAFPSRTVGSAPMGVRFDASCSTGTVTKYVWDFGDGATSEQLFAASQDHIFSTPGLYQVKLEITDGKGNFSSTNIPITVR